MGASADLSRAPLAAVDQHDAAAVRAMLAPTVDYRNRDFHATTPDEVVANYQRTWDRVPGLRADLRQILEQGDTAALEVTARDGDTPRAECMAIHQWRNGKLVHYRMYVDEPRLTT